MLQWFSNALAKALIASDQNPLPVYFPNGISIQLVTFPASAVAAGTAGQMAYQNGYAALCVSTNAWVFWSTSSDYPF